LRHGTNSDSSKVCAPCQDKKGNIPIPPSSSSSSLAVTLGITLEDVCKIERIILKETDFHFKIEPPNMSCGALSILLERLAVPEIVRKSAFKILGSPEYCYSHLVLLADEKGVKVEDSDRVMACAALVIAAENYNNSHESKKKNKNQNTNQYNNSQSSIVSYDSISSNGSGSEPIMIDMSHWERVLRWDGKNLEKVVDELHYIKEVTVPKLKVWGRVSVRSLRGCGTDIL
jgi:predicted nucleic acid binding AN1-type Zn finger protein